MSLGRWGTRRRDRRLALARSCLLEKCQGRVDAAAHGLASGTLDFEAEVAAAKPEARAPATAPTVGALLAVIVTVRVIGTAATLTVILAAALVGPTLPSVRVVGTVLLDP